MPLAGGFPVGARLDLFLSHRTDKTTARHGPSQAPSCLGNFHLVSQDRGASLVPVYRVRDNPCMALSKLLGRNRYIKTNTQKGSPREGQKYVDTRSGDDVSHRYGLNGGKPAEVKWNKSKADLKAINDRLSPQTPPAPSTPDEKAVGEPLTPDVKAAAAKNGLVNQLKTSERYGKRFTKTSRGGWEGHLYADGTFVKMRKVS